MIRKAIITDVQINNLRAIGTATIKGEEMQITLAFKRAVNPGGTKKNKALSNETTRHRVKVGEIVHFTQNTKHPHSAAKWAPASCWEPKTEATADTGEKKPKVEKKKPAPVSSAWTPVPVSVPAPAPAKPQPKEIGFKPGIEGLFRAMRQLPRGGVQQLDMGSLKKMAVRAEEKGSLGSDVYIEEFLGSRTFERLGNNPLTSPEARAYAKAMKAAAKKQAAPAKQELVVA